MKYERLTERDRYGRAILKNEKVNKDIAELNLNFSTVFVLDKIVSQFCELEDKIENGTLVELPFMRHLIQEKMRFAEPTITNLLDI